MKKHLIALCIALLLPTLLCAGGCQQTRPSQPPQPPAQEIPTTDTESQDEQQTEPPVQTLTPSGQAELAENFSFEKVYAVAPTTREESVQFDLGDLRLQVNMNSTFYGTESAIDRDSYHWGNILRYTDRKIKDFNQPFSMGDLDGDRRDEILTYRDGVLCAYTLPKSAKKPRTLPLVLTQELGFAGVLCGTGHLNGDGYTDLVFYDTDKAQAIVALGGKDGFTYTYAGALEGLSNLSDKDYLMCGDTDADGVCEIVWVNDLDVTVYKYDGTAFSRTSHDTLPYAESGQFLTYAVSDLNSDGAADVVCYMKDPAGAEFYGTRTYMSRRDGHFGSYEHEGDNKNLNVTHIHNECIIPILAAGGDTTGDGVDKVALIGQNPTTGEISLYSVEYLVEAPAYDYSSHVIKTDDGYILYTGGLYIDYNTDKYPQTDGDHIVAYTSKDGMTWHRNLDAACFYLGGELGLGGYQPGDVYSEKWWYGNTMEPEVLLVDGIYYMYYQVENYTYDRSGNLMGADRIGVATSTDGIHFERKTDSPALICSDQYSCFTHQEVIYVPDDPDGLCYWMYVRYVHNNAHVKFVRVRSADPTCFDLDKDCTEISGWHQIGNQVGYINDYDGQGNRLFVRITFAEYAEGGNQDRVHTVPTLQFSQDGIHWYLSGLYMAGADPDNKDEWARRNVYFLGFSTLNGTGELARAADGNGYEFIWVSCTCDAPVAPNIFYSSEGMGKATFTLEILP